MATVGATYAFIPAASDPEGAPLSFSIVNKPPWAAFSASTGRLSGTPTAAAEGVHVDIVIRVSDGKLAGRARAVRHRSGRGQFGADDRGHAADGRARRTGLRVQADGCRC